MLPSEKPGIRASRNESNSRRSSIGQSHSDSSRPAAACEPATLPSLAAASVGRLPHPTRLERLPDQVAPISTDDYLFMPHHRSGLKACHSTIFGVCTASPASGASATGGSGPLYAGCPNLASSSLESFMRPSAVWTSAFGCGSRDICFGLTIAQGTECQALRIEV
jgi:hypothetical protein